jgi:hypothetical protein
MKKTTETPHASFHLTLVPGWEFLRFVVRLVQTELATMRTGERADFVEDFQRYMGGVALVGVTGNCIVAYPVSQGPLSEAVFPLPHEYTEADFTALKQQLAPFVENETNDILVATLHDVLSAWSICYPDASTMGRRLLTVSGPTASCFLRMVTWLLEQDQPRRLRACPACGRIFVRMKHQAFCGRTCASRTMQRKYRARHEAVATTA